jgi:Mce-associated membrane protein
VLPRAGEPSIEDAEAKAASAEARAEAARARAVQLRRKAEEAAAPPVRRWRLRRPGWLRRPAWTVVAVGAALMLSCALFGASASMWWQHRLAVAGSQRAAEFTAAARRAATDLMSIDFNTAQQGVQRVIDDSTGQFKGQYQDSARQLVKAMQDSKVVTKVTVNAVAVESMSRDSAQVLVAATTQRHNAADSTDRPATWRMTISLDTVGGQPKMSNVAFLG